jgi:conjugal transfer pilus assembly protein TraA
MKRTLWLMGLMMIVGSGIAWAGSDTTFSDIVTTVTGWLQGSLGTLMALFGAAIGVGSAIQGNWTGMGTGIGVAAGSYYLPQIIPTITQGLL